VHACPTCQRDHVIHKGSAAGKPQNRWKPCGEPFPRMTPRGKPLAMTGNAVLWYLSAMSMTRIASLLRVSAQAVLPWMRTCATDSYEKPEPTGRTLVLQRDEMWHYLKKKQQKLWIWTALNRDTRQLLDWECGRRDQKPLKKMVDRLTQWDVQRYCPDTWAPYAAVIPQEKLVQRTATTHNLERHHCRHRHWFGRCKRKSMIISTSKEMVDLTMALCARFWVNSSKVWQYPYTGAAISLHKASAERAVCSRAMVRWRPPEHSLFCIPVSL
jgi:IS1 family transposase/transposase-like protein